MGRPSLRTMILHPQRAINYLLRDRYTTARSGGACNGTFAEPGSGARTVSGGNASRAAILSGRLEFQGNVAGPGQDVAVYYGPFTANTGLAMRVTAQAKNTGLSGFMNVGFTASTGVTPEDGGLVWAPDASQFFRATNNSTSAERASLAAYSLSTDYTVLLAHTSWGRHVLLKLDTGAYQYLYPARTNADYSGGAYVCIAGYQGEASATDLRVFNLGGLDARFTSAYGLARQRLTSPSASTSFAHTTDGGATIEFTYTHSNVTGLNVRFRQTGASDYWMVNGQTDGNLVLYQTTGGVTSSRGSTGGGTLTNTTVYRVVIRTVGNVTRVYLNNVLRITYTDNSNQGLTSSTGLVVAVGGGISELVSWPYYVYLPQGV